MTDFQFQPWERLSPEVTDGPADACVELDGQQWLWRRCGQMLWVRHATENGPNFLVNDDLEDLTIEARVISNNSADLPWFLSYSDWKGSLNRVWELDSTVFAAWSENDSWWLHKTQEWPSWASTSFAFAPPQESSASTYQSLLAERENPASDLSYSLHFIGLSDLERALLSIETRIGTPREFVALVCALLRVSSSHWPAAWDEMELEFAVTGSRGRFQVRPHSTRLLPLNTRENAILGHIVRGCEPRQFADDATLSATIRTLHEGAWSCPFRIEVSRPSMHERLEAILELRAWLSQHWPAGVAHLEKIV